MLSQLWIIEQKNLGLRSCEMDDPVRHRRFVAVEKMGEQEAAIKISKTSSFIPIFYEW